MIGKVNHLHVEHLAVAMAERGFEVIVAGDTEALLPPTSLREMGIPVYDAPPASHNTPVWVIQNVRWIRRLIRDLRPDIVHAHWLCGFAAFAALAGAKPLVSMAWGSDVLRATRVKNFANRIALRRSSFAIADSQELLDRMVQLGIARNRVSLISHGVDLERFSPGAEARQVIRERLGLGSGPLILGARTLLPLYNPGMIIDAFGLVKDEFPDAELVLLSLTTTGFDLGGRVDLERVRVVGHVEHEMMAEYFRASDVCISIPSSDGSPRTVWEALACGCPTIVSDLPWVRELIVPDRDALVVPLDPESVAASIRRVLRDPALGRAFGEHGRALVAAHKSRDREMDKLASLYLSTAGKALPR